MLEMKCVDAAEREIHLRKGMRHMTWWVLFLSIW
jgi:hypothetical protein